MKQLTREVRTFMDDLLARDRTPFKVSPTREWVYLLLDTVTKYNCNTMYIQEVREMAALMKADKWPGVPDGAIRIREKDTPAGRAVELIEGREFLYAFDLSGVPSMEFTINWSK